MQWANTDFQDIKISKVGIEHRGNYTCEDDSGRNATVELEVEYFKEGSARFLESGSESNPSMTFVCSVFSYPAPAITIVLNTQYGSKGKYVCEPDPGNHNMNKCTQTTRWNATKRDNGKTQSCVFNYKDLSMTYSATVDFRFSPTVVKITGNRKVTKEPSLGLTCSTDSSNPVSELIWRTGENEDALEDFVSFDPVVQKAEFNGQNVTQDIRLHVTNDMNNGTIFCCAKEMCDSVKLNINLPLSGVATVTARKKWILCALVVLIRLI